MIDKIIDYLEQDECSITQLKNIWEILYEDWEEFPGNSSEAISLIEDSITVAETKKVKKIYKILFKDEDD